MRKKLLTLSILAAVVLSMAGCGSAESSTAPETKEPVAEEISADTAPEEEEIDGMGNPIECVPYEKIVEVTDCSVTLPENMENPTYLLVNNELGEIRFQMENGAFDMTFRVQKADTFTDISGLYFDWTEVTDSPVLDYETAEYSYSGDDGNLRLILWFNQYQKVMYSLSVQGAALDGFDLYTVAANMAMTDVPLEDYPSNALEERTGKTEFASYDEIIGLLQGDEAYALVDILGYDGKVLLVTDGVFDNLDGNMAAIGATLYTAKSSGKVTADSSVSSVGTAYPLAIDKNGLIYSCMHTEVDAYCYGTNGTNDVALMMMQYISSTDVDANGAPVKVSGFYRELSDLSVLTNESIEYAEDDVAALQKAFDDYSAAKVIGFTTAKTN